MTEKGKKRKKTSIIGNPKQSEATETKQEPRFSRNQLLASDRFQNQRDILNALLLPENTYTIAEAEEQIEAYRKGKVK